MKTLYFIKQKHIIMDNQEKNNVPSDSYIVDIYKSYRGAYKVIDNHVFYLECGMEMKMPLFLKSGDTERHSVKQVTIRDISIAKKYQKHKLFTTFVKWLLVERKITVCLESVQPKWFKDRLYSSPHWILQTPEETKNWNPMYVRFPSENDKEIFTLF
jgi:hypothetical protein